MRYPCTGTINSWLCFIIFARPTGAKKNLEKAARFSLPRKALVNRGSRSTSVSVLHTGQCVRELQALVVPKPLIVINKISYGNQLTLSYPFIEINTLSYPDAERLLGQLPECQLCGCGHFRHHVRSAVPRFLALLLYRGTSPIRNSALLGPYRGPMPRVLWWPLGGRLFLMSEVPLQC